MGVGIPDPECTSGYTRRQVEEILGDEFPAFTKWMYGQTMSLCEGKRYNHKIREYEVDCDGVAHGPIVYEWDLKRYLGIVPGKEIWD